MIKNDPNSPISASPLGAIGMFQAVDSATDSLTRPAVITNRAFPKVNIDDDEPVIGANAKRPKVDFSKTGSSQEKDDTSFSYAMMLFAQFAQNQADDNGEMTSQSITTFVDMLEKVGMDVAPLKKTLEEISGKSWADLSSDTKGTSFNVSGFYAQGPKGERTPRMHNPGFDSLQAIRCSQTDNAGGGYCAKGTANILESMGYKVTRGHATEWDDTLPKNGWVKLRGVDPRNAPEGAVLVYDSDLERGRAARNNGGGKYGHVEVVAKASDGHTVFVSDKARDNFGGSVPNNFEGAYMYVGPGAPATNRAIVAQANSPHHAGPALALS